MPDDDRVSLDPLKPMQALKALLSLGPKAQDDKEHPAKPKAERPPQRRTRPG